MRDMEEPRGPTPCLLMRWCGLCNFLKENDKMPLGEVAALGTQNIHEGSRLAAMTICVEIISV